MDVRADFDWLSSTPDDIKALYGVTRRLAVARQQTVPQILRDALGLSYSESYIETFSAGRISKKNCARLHQWLRERHATYAAELNRELTRGGDFLPRMPHRFYKALVPKMLGYLSEDSEWRHVPRSEMVRRARERLEHEDLRAASLAKLPDAFR
jgi:hypothetical protein